MNPLPPLLHSILPAKHIGVTTSYADWGKGEREFPNGGGGG